MSLFRDYSLNYRDNKISNFIEGQFPSFLREDGADFIDFIETYYKFLETKIVKITVETTDEDALNAITDNATTNVDLITGSSHFLVCENGTDPIITIDGIEYSPYKENTSNVYISTSLVEDISSVYDSTHNKTIVAYRDTKDNKSYAKILKDSTSFFEPSLFTSDVITNIKTEYSSVNNKLLIAYSNLTEDSAGNLVIGEVVYNSTTGYSTVFDAPIVFHSGPTKNISICCIPSKQLFVIFFTSIETTEKVYAKIGSFYNGELSLTDNILIKTGNVQYVDSILDTINNKIILSYNDVTYSHGASIIVNVIDEDGLTFSNENVFNSSPSLFISTSFDENTGTVAIFYQDFLNDKKGTVTTCKISDGSLISDSSVYIFNANETTDIDSVYDPVSKRMFVTYSSKQIVDEKFRLTEAAVADLQRVVNGATSGYYAYDFKDVIEGIPNITAPYMAGDVNNDGVIDNLDVLYFSKYITDEGVSTVPTSIKNFIENDLKTQLTSTAEHDVLYETYYILEPGYTYNLHLAKVIDISTLSSTDSEASFSNDIVSSSSLSYNKSLERIVLSYNEQYNFIGKTDIFAPFQFNYTINNEGHGWTPGNNLNITISGGSGSGATAEGIINDDGVLSYLIWYNGRGYLTNPLSIPYVDSFGGDEVHDVYIGLGDDDEPLLEQEGYIGITGKYLGHEDLDTVATGGSLKRAIYLDHYSGDPSRALVDNNYGELYNQILLDHLKPNTYLPTICDVEEFETPISAMNNIHNYSDIDYSFNAKLFLGNDTYSKMYNEIMHNWPNLAPSVETNMKAIIGRNIRDIYNSKGTEEAIKFAIKIIYGRNSTVWSPADRLFSLNGGNWIALNSFVIDTFEDQTETKNYLKLPGRLLYNTSSLVLDYTKTYHDKIETLYIATTNDHKLRDGMFITLIDDPYYDGRYKITVVDSKTVSININYRSVNFNQPAPGLKIAYQFGVIETATINSTSNNYIDITLSNVSGSFNTSDTVVCILNTGDYFYSILTSQMVETRKYNDNKNLLNGGIQLSVPVGSDSLVWDGINTAHLAEKLSDHINTDRLQDGEYYQLFSYVISLGKENPPLIRRDSANTESGLYTAEEIINTVKEFVHPAGFKLILEEEY